RRQREDVPGGDRLWGDGAGVTGCHDVAGAGGNYWVDYTGSSDSGGADEHSCWRTILRGTPGVATKRHALPLARKVTDFMA
ncbi:hypothetical protein KI387_042031, partial [Taxus chinensis]